MTDPGTRDLFALAEEAGVSTSWSDYRKRPHDVSPETIRAVLVALGLDAGSPKAVAESRAHLAEARRRLFPMVTATVGQPVPIPATGRWSLTMEDGTTLDGMLEENGTLPAIGTPGYHRLEIEGAEASVAVAPTTAFRVADAAPGARPWALAVQLYGLRHENDGGLGDFASLVRLAPSAARLGAAGLAISPVHAQFSADVERFSPYSPSSRTRLNVLHAALDLPDTPETRRLEALPLVDWPAASRLRIQAMRQAYEAATPTERADLARYRAEQGEALESHARFEALHAEQVSQGRWHWREWPAALRDPSSPAVQAFADAHAHEVGFHAWMQMQADRSLGAAQRACRDAGMPIGLIADLAVGADSGGSQCWARQAEILPGMSIGAPPDLLSTNGQNWGLAAFNPAGLREHGFHAFREMLQSAMRHAGGVRIDHALGLARLWVVPDGASAKDGAYLSFPMDDLLRLIAIESRRHRAIVLGEDLGTIPPGFQDRLAETGILGMRVLWFEKSHGLFTEPRIWDRGAAAMTGTHDLPTVAGWWSGRDIEWRTELGLSGDDPGREQDERAQDRPALWAAFRHSGAAEGDVPAPETTEPVVDAALRHLATAANELVIVPIEDALGLAEQPNLPGTTGEAHPNWRRRLVGPAADLLAPQAVQSRLSALTKGRLPA